METVTIWLTPKYIVEKILTIEIISNLNDSSELRDIDREPFEVYLRDFKEQRVALIVNFKTFYRLTRFCDLL